MHLQSVTCLTPSRCGDQALLPHLLLLKTATRFLCLIAPPCPSLHSVSLSQIHPCTLHLAHQHCSCAPSHSSLSATAQCHWMPNLFCALGSILTPHHHGLPTGNPNQPSSAHLHLTPVSHASPLEMMMIWSLHSDQVHPQPHSHHAAPDSHPGSTPHPFLSAWTAPQCHPLHALAHHSLHYHGSSLSVDHWQTRSHPPHCAC